MPTTKTINFLPAIFQSDANQKFLNATLDQLMTEPNLIPVNGYVGRKFAPGYVSAGNFVTEPTADRANYQLEPSIVVKNQTLGNVEFNVTYPEVIQQISYYGGKINNHDRLWSSEYYSYDPKINVDAFANFNQYYWLANGPDAVDVFAGNVESEKTYFISPDSNAKVYEIGGYKSISNPDLMLARGGTYQFKVNQTNKPFWIQTNPGISGQQINNSNFSSRQVLGVTDNGQDIGTVTFDVPYKDAQDFYINLPFVQNVDLVTTLKYSDIQGQTLSTFNSTYNGIDGQTNLDGKYLIFGQYYSDAADWTVGMTTVPSNQRYGIWQISITSGVIGLTYITAIPQNEKVTITTGIVYANTNWYTNSANLLAQVPIITAPLTTLYYQDGVVEEQYGIIRIVDSNNYSIDITTEILGKQNYISPNGVKFTNGLKVKFDSSVTPASYQNKEYYVDGVGTGILLTLVDSLAPYYANLVTTFDGSLDFTAAATAELNSAKDQLTVTTTDFPPETDVFYGSFPNAANPNPIVKQSLLEVYPYRPGQNVQGDHASISLRSGPIGISLPGIPLHGPSNEWYVPSNSTVWHYDIAKARITGQDIYGGYTGPDGDYRYNDSTFITANAWGSVSGFTNGEYTQVDGHSKIIGWAQDGYPIYGPWGYIDPEDPLSGTQKMVSSYFPGSTGSDRPVAKTVTVAASAISTSILSVDSTYGLNPGMRVGMNSAGITPGSAWIISCGLQTAVGPGNYVSTAYQVQLNTNVTVDIGDTIEFEFIAGTFIEDYSYVEGLGDLDRFNGRYCVTPEFPDGTYAYFATQDPVETPVYPYFVGSAFYGSLQADPNTSLAIPDYIVINRSSRDLSMWSKHNRWFHKDVIEAAAIYNNTLPLYDQDFRAKRPIIEFIPNLQLYDFGKRGLLPIDVLDESITQPFSTVQGASSAVIDDLDAYQGMRVIFAADEDSATVGKIWTITFVDLDGSGNLKIYLEEDTSITVTEGDTIGVLTGSNHGKCYWYNGVAWVEGQEKTSVNQAPKFDVFDSTGISFGDRIKYPISNNSLAFYGTKLFSYKTNTTNTINDPVLGFPLSYKNFNNSGDIEFYNNFDNDNFLYTIDKKDYTQKINTGYLRQNNEDNTYSILNVWSTVQENTKQYQDLGFEFDGLNTSFTIDITPNPNITSKNLLVYVNYKKLSDSDYQTDNLPRNKKLITIKSAKLTVADRVDILVYSDSVSNVGFYNIPDNLNLNAQNNILVSPTLGDMRNHVGRLTDKALKFTGSYPGVSNLRDINVVNQGGTILQQSAPTSYASLFLCNTNYNFVNSLFFASQEYTRFKNKFITIASNSNRIDYTDPVSAVDIILKQISLPKNSTFPWYYSGMVPYGDNKNTITYTVFNAYQKRYEITNIFSNEEITNRAILVYLNGAQLLYGSEYTFLTVPGVLINDNIQLNVDDVITIVEYYNTDGCYVPETPSKLGLYPKYNPKIYTDYTYIIPQTFVQGHDGSLTPTFGDFRDDLLLELEKRIFNNIKVSYDENLVSLYDSIPGKFRNIGYSLTEYNAVLTKTYLQWIGQNNLNYIDNSTYQLGVPFTYNYGSALDVVNEEKLPGSWRACFEYFYDTTRPHTHPWEMLGFSDIPSWWENYYGPAPYTSGNTILWTDLQNGYIADGTRQGTDSRFARPGLLNFIPVNENGVLLPPLGLLTKKYDLNTFDTNWKVGQFSPTETAWRNSSDYAFAIQYISALLHPAKYFSLGIATHKYKYNTELNQYLVTDTNARLSPADIDINGYVSTSGDITRAASYINWIGDFNTSLGILSKESLVHYVHDHTVQLSYRIAGFSGKQYFKILAEQNSPDSINQSVIIPDSDIDLVLNKSTPVDNLRYSALIIERSVDGWQISGYDSSHPYFVIIPPVTTGSSYYVTTLDQSVNYYEEFSNYKILVPYGTTFTTYQQVATFIAGYESYLSSNGFLFDRYDADLGEIRNWALSTKEFLFWAQQEWPVGSVLVLNPSGSVIRLRTTTAVVDTISNSYYGSKVMTQNYVVLDSGKYSVLRYDNLFTISMDNANGDLIGYLDLNLVQFEHSVIFNNKTQFNDTIYDPNSGQRQFKLKFVGSKTGGWTGTFAPPGFIYNKPGVMPWASVTDYLKGDLVEYKNFYYAANKNLAGADAFSFSDWLPVDKTKIKTGLLSNFARNSSLAKNFYNVDKVNLESEFDLAALSLIGYKNRSYLNDLGLDDTTQVKFYQGFIQEKGTRNAIDALGRVQLGTDKTSYTIDEEWAFRVGSYGSLETNQFVELVLDANYVLNDPTSIEVVDNQTVTYSSLYTQLDEIYKTSSTNWSSPFLVTRTSNSSYSDDIQTAGFVNIEDVDYTIFDISDTTTLNINVENIGVGNTIWTAKDYTNDWNVYRVDETNLNITEINNALNNNLLFTTNKYHNLSVGDIVIVLNFNRFNGFYKVSTVPTLDSFTSLYSGSLTSFSKLTGHSTLYKLRSLRFDRASEVTNYTPIGGWKANNKVWINYESSDVWAVYNKTEPWKFERVLPQTSISANLNYGSAVKLSYDNKFALVGQPGYNANLGAITTFVQSLSGQLIENGTLYSSAANTVNFGSTIDLQTLNVIVGAPTSDSGRGYVFAYTKDFTGQLTPNQIITVDSSASPGFGTSISLSDDEQWLYIGAPGTDQVYVYIYDNSVTKLTETITPPNAYVSVFTLSTFTPDSQDLLYISKQSIEYIPYVDYTVSGSVITFTANTGLGDIVVRQRPGFKHYTTITYPNAGSNFGYSIASSTDGAQIAIGSPNAVAISSSITGNVFSSNIGTVSIYDRSIENFIATSASQTIFTTQRTVGPLSKVYVDSVLQTKSVTYNATGTQVTFTSPPGVGKVITVETNEFNKIQETTATTSYNNQQFGYSIDLCSENCSIYAGAPYQSSTGFFNGAVYRLVNQGRVYGEVIGTHVLEQTVAIAANIISTTADITVNSTANLVVGMTLNSATSINVPFNATIINIDTNSKVITLSSNVTGNLYTYDSITFTRVNNSDSIRINNFEVVFDSGTRLTNIISSINNKNIPGVTAVSSNGKLKLTSNSQVNFDKLKILPGVGTALEDIGITVFVETQTIKNTDNHNYDYFGKKVKINNNSDVLFVGSDIANTIEPTTYDVATAETFFDADSTRFKDYIQTSGSVWTFSYLPDSRDSVNYPGKFNFVERLTPYPSLKSQVGFGHDIDVNDYSLLVGSYTDNTYGSNTGIVYQFSNRDRLNGWDVYRQQTPKVDVDSLVKAYTYSVDDQTILNTLDYIDPAKGKILGIAEQEISYKTDYDPAVYNIANISTVSSSTSLHWADTHVGKIWWDLSAIRYLDYEQGSIKYRTINWGRSFPGSSVDVYEWVESVYPPGQYVARGGDGEPKYTNNSAYSTLVYVDPSTNTPTVKYYFWVKNKTTVTTNQFGRQLPTVTIADYITNPRVSGIKYLAALRNDSVAVFNVLDTVSGKNTVLHIDYSTNVNNTNIIHNEYALLPEIQGTANTIPDTIYRKLLDSASGIDPEGNPVPDPLLPVHVRYGIDVRPRQSMFIDRSAAIMEMVTYVNGIFSKNIISQGFDLSSLESAEPLPTAGEDVYDLSVNTNEELLYIDITSKPIGYRVLVVSDGNVGNLWTVYTKQSTNTWLLTRVQSYKTSDYWDYADWYADGYNSKSAPTYTVNTYADISNLTLHTNDLVKILNSGQGKWVLLKIYPNIINTVGIESGTIALSESLYKLEKFGMGFGNDNFDSERFDQNPSIEIRKILEALRNNIFINQLREDFLQLFYVFVYYVLDEQKYIDWAFKTSFITVLHKFRGLNQPQIYSKDNQEYYKQYIEEVKPYKTTIREYVLDYQGTDNLNGYVTDFDVPSYYDSTLRMYRSPSGEFIQDARTLTLPQYKDWLSSYEYYIDSIVIENGGSGYTLPPVVTITGSDIGNDAVARALVTDGVVTKIEVLYGGSNYIIQPTVVISGGNGIGASAYAMLKNNVVRKTHTTMVYDRITYDTTVSDWTANTEYFQGNIINYNGSAYAVTTNFTSSSSFNGSNLLMYPANRFNTANDRIQGYYQPLTGETGKNFALLQSGISYPGVLVDGSLYTEHNTITPFNIDPDGSVAISDEYVDGKIESFYTDGNLGIRPEDIVIDGSNYVDTYSSHAPEELIPGRVFDTLEMIVKTLRTDPSQPAYTNWVSSTAFTVSEISIVDGGRGYTKTADPALLESNISVTISGTTGSGATVSSGDITLDANGTITGITLTSGGSVYTTIPNVTITGSNANVAIAGVKLTQNTYDTFGYRIFKDMRDNYSYIRIPAYGYTFLTSNLSITDTEFFVSDINKISTPTPTIGTPGVVFINGERLAYHTKNKNSSSLTELRRGTSGTGANVFYPAGTRVESADLSESVPNSDHYTWTPVANVSATTTSGNSYTFLAGTSYIRSNLWLDTADDTTIPTNGFGLYDSNKIPALFVKQKTE
jgi:hypothetical protein